MFNTEKSLVDALLFSLTNNGLSIFNICNFDYFWLDDEVNVGNGIADIVVSFFNERDGRKNTLELDEISIMYLFNRYKKLSLEDIGTKSGIPSKNIAASIKKLIEEDYISINNDEFTLAKEYVLMFEKTISIEAKLKKWRRALIQAYRYKSFSDFSYVCLPEEESRKAIENIEDFVLRNVGLMTIDDWGTVHVIFGPAEERPLNPKKNMLLNEKFLTAINSS